MIELSLLNDDARLAGNWWAFPPPAPGFYHLRQVWTSEGIVTGKVRYLPNRRVYEYVSNGRMMCMGRRLSRMRPENGWQFQFLPHEKLKWVPRVVQWNFVSGSNQPERVGHIDVSNQLPIAASREEALYIVRLFPERWPAFVHQHVEFVETPK